MHFCVLNFPLLHHAILRLFLLPSKSQFLQEIAVTVMKALKHNFLVLFCPRYHPLAILMCKKLNVIEKNLQCYEIWLNVRFFFSDPSKLSIVTHLTLQRTLLQIQILTYIIQFLLKCCVSRGFANCLSTVTKTTQPPWMLLCQLQNK